MNATSPASLIQAVDCFVSRYHAHPTLVGDQHDWSVVIGLCAPDTAERVAVVVNRGRVTAVEKEPAEDRLLEEATIVATADSAVLRDILCLRKSPNEPYLFGELLVSGPEPDFLRLDYIVTTLCARS
jgi:hypothetical protein